jgi:hypothetical protein
MTTFTVIHRRSSSEQSTSLRGLRGPKDQERFLLALQMVGEGHRH